MTCSKVEIDHDLGGASYVEFVNYAFSIASSGYLVVRDDLGRHDSLRDFLISLRASIISETRVSEWPGTRLLGGLLATMYAFRATDEVRSLLLRTTDHLYGWAQPDLPEDIGFYDGKGALLLDTAIDENSTFLYLDDLRRQTIKKKYPNLWSVLSSASAGPK